MKVKELIDGLQDLNPEAEVCSPFISVVRGQCSVGYTPISGIAVHTVIREFNKEVYIEAPESQGQKDIVVIGSEE